VLGLNFNVCCSYDKSVNSLASGITHFKVDRLLNLYAIPNLQGPNSIPVAVIDIKVSNTMQESLLWEPNTRSPCQEFHFVMEPEVSLPFTQSPQLNLNPTF
jgi:hypothetical protein